ncbi:ribonuclease BN (tRNA processing enzyme) [Arcanobacterium pluranimalium]|uniref:MBL fold metallo-hydrolase n=1 Tax=Arcanobacterium pluranimalium TaxID=108028 RepID=UPI001956CE8F|nr:MBL fold metallo-hydrolase [Arcanobacterium pluranimalium]MBM7825194.1 ribonuclease BN (tRNA processing enzyme) [Arcanobacterium pluranimalium]
MKLTIIGCSGSMSGKRSAASSYLIQAKERTSETDRDSTRTWSVVLDFGPGAMGQLLNYLDPAMLDSIIASHLHADHFADIVGMQVYRRWYPEGALARIPVYTPGDGVARTRGIADDPADEDYATEFDFVKVGAGTVIELGPMKIEFFQAHHTIPALSIRITAPSEEDPNKDVVFTYSGDTDTCEGVIEAARGANLFLCEAAFEEGRDTVRGVHMTGLRAGEVAQEAGAQKLLLTHLQPWTSREKTKADAQRAYDGEVHVVQAGEEYTF